MELGRMFENSASRSQPSMQRAKPQRLAESMGGSGFKALNQLMAAKRLIQAMATRSSPTESISGSFRCGTGVVAPVGAQSHTSPLSGGFECGTGTIAPGGAQTQISPTDSSNPRRLSTSEMLAFGPRSAR
jgi:hypothetical protein